MVVKGKLKKLPELPPLEEALSEAFRDKLQVTLEAPVAIKNNYVNITVEAELIPPPAKK